MPRPWQYTRFRRTMMQIVMWLILGSTVGLAALLSHGRVEARRVKLDQQHVHPLGDLLVRLPSGWEVGRRRMGDAAVLIAQESQSDSQSDEEDDRPTGRTLSIIHEPTSELPPQYLLNRIGRYRNVEEFRFLNQPALLVTAPKTFELPDGSAVAAGWTMYACTVIPPGNAVLVQLQGIGLPTEADRQAIRLVTKAMATRDSVKER